MRKADRKMSLRRLREKAMRAHLRRSKVQQKGEAAAQLGPGGGEEIAPVPAPVLEAPEAAPGTPEPIPEALWPEVGVKVAVGVEALAHCLRLGETGVSEGPAPDDPSEVLVLLKGAGMPMRIPRSLLVPVGSPMSDLRLWDKCSDKVKRDLLCMVGVGDPRDEVLPTTTSVRLTLWGEYVPIGLRLEERKFKFVPPAFVKAFEDGHAMMKRAEAGEFRSTFADLEDQAQRQQVRQTLLTEWWDKNEVLLVCMCDEASGTSALLALRKTPISARYYEAGAEGRGAISRQILLMLGHLEGVPHEVPQRSNCSGLATEALIAHYIEGEIREAKGETRGCLGWPPVRIKRVKGYLSGLHTSIEAARRKWCIEENAIEAKRKQITEEVVARVLKSEERRQAFEARWNEVKARNLRTLDEGTFEGPIVPIGFKPLEAPPQKRSGDEAKADKVSFLHVLDELPEGVRRVHEGGSSGSSDPVPPARLELEACQALEDDFIFEAKPEELREQDRNIDEAAPSKAEEVRQKIAEAPTRLETEAYRALEDEFIVVAKPEDLREQDRKIYEAVKGVGLGVCPRCRFLYGCQSCDEEKAWGFACRSTLWHTASEGVRPKAKPRGRPKKAA